MHRVGLWGFACLILVLIASSLGAQEPILTLDVASDPVQIQAGGRAWVRITIENPSAHEADDVTLSWGGSEVFAWAEEVPAIEVLPPFDTETIDLLLAASAGVEEGVHEEAIEVVYTYCIAELCFQIVEEVAVAVDVTSAVPVEGPTETPPVELPAAAFPWRWVGGGIGMLALLGGIVLRRTSRLTWPANLAILGTIIGGLAYGVLEGQHEQAQGIGAVLCTSCVGIEETRTREPEFSPQGLATLESITEPVELVVFYAPWCHACPYAKELVEQAAESNRWITFSLSDVEQEPAFAEAHGIIRSGRTVVPAILRIDTGAVIFGIENLEIRLLQILQGEA